MNRQMIAMFAASGCLAGTLFAGDGGVPFAQPGAVLSSAAAQNEIVPEEASATADLTVILGDATSLDGAVWTDANGVCVEPNPDIDGTLRIVGSGQVIEAAPGAKHLILENVTLKLTEPYGDNYETYGITVGVGATLDVGTYQMTRQIVLAGGTLTNTVGEHNNSQHQFFNISLSADSTWNVPEGKTMASIAGSYADHTLALNGHMLKKTGKGMLRLISAAMNGGTSEKPGTFYIAEGKVEHIYGSQYSAPGFAVSSKDWELRNLTLKIDEGAELKMSSEHWTRSSGVIAVDLGRGVTLDVPANWGHISANEQVTSFTKRGEGTLNLMLCEVHTGYAGSENNSMYTCPTVIEGGCMNFNGACTLPNGVTVKAGAAVGTCGNAPSVIPELTFEAGSVLKAAADVCVCANVVTGTAEGDLSALVPDSTSMVLKAPQSDTFVLSAPAKGRFFHKDGGYWYTPIDSVLSAEASGEAAWAKLNWNKSNVSWDKLGPYSEAELTLGGDTTLKMDCPLSLGTLTAAGMAGAAPELAVKSTAAVTASRVRLTLLRRNDKQNDGCAFSEFRLMHGGKPLSLRADKNEHQVLVDGKLCDEDLDSKWAHWGCGVELNDVFEFYVSDGETFVFDSYGLASADVTRRNPAAWKLDLCDADGNWVPFDTFEMTSDAADRWAPNTWLDRTVRGHVDTVRLSNVTLTELTCADTLVFGSNCTVKAVAGGAVACKQASGSVTVDTAALTGADYPFCALRTASSGALTVTLQGEGVLKYVNGAYWVFAFEPMLTAEVSDEQGWETLVWTAPDGTQVSAGELMPSLEENADITLTGRGTVLLNAPVNVNALTIAGDVVLGGTGMLTVAGAVTVNQGATLTADATRLTLSEMTTINGVLKYSAAAETALAVRNGSGKVMLSSSKAGETLADRRVCWDVSGTYGVGIFCDNGELKVTGGNATFGRAVQLRQSILALRGIQDRVTLGEGCELTLCESMVYSDAGKGSLRGGSIAVRDSATLTGSYAGNDYSIDSPISGTGTLTLSTPAAGHQNRWRLNSVISGGLEVRVDPGTYVTLAGDNTFTGGLTVSEGVRLAHSRAAGIGDITVTGGLETEGGAILEVCAGKTLLLKGELKGAVLLNVGAVVDGSAGTITGDVTFADGVTSGTPVILKLPEGATAGSRVLACANASTLDIGCFAVFDLLDGLQLVCNPEGTAFVLAEGEVGPEPKPEPEFSLPEGFGTLPEGVVAELKSLLASVTVPEGAQMPTKVSQIVADADSDATPGTLADALAVFTDISSATVDPNDPSAAVVTVSYMFGVADMCMVSLEGVRRPVLVVSVETRKNGTIVPAGFAAGTQVLGASVMPDGTEARKLSRAESSGTELTAEERAAVFGPDASTAGRVYLKLPPVDGDSAFFRVRAVRP